MMFSTIFWATILLARQICKTYDSKAQDFYTRIGVKPEVQKTRPSLSGVHKY